MTAQAPSTRLEEATTRRLLVKLLPFLILCYVVAFLDRVNIGFAGSFMKEELGLTATLFGFGTGIFAIGYFLFEVPSNLILHRVGARVWIARIMITWGIVSALTAFVWSPASFVAVRFLLGVDEAGFFPGIVLYLTLWFPRRSLGRATAMFVIGLPIAVVIGAPISTAVIAWADGIANLAGWRWMFLLEGGLAVIVGCLVYLRLSENPASAKFLSAEQRDWLIATLRRERRDKEALRRYSVIETLRNRRVLILAACIFCNITALFGITLWMPQVIAGFGGLGPNEANLLSAVPYLCAGLAMYLCGHHSDRTEERRFHILIPAAIGGLGLTLAAAADSPMVGLIGLCFGAAGILASNVLFWAIPSMFLTAAASAAGIAAVNSVGNLGGFVGPYLNSWVRDAFGSHSAGMYALAAMVTIYGVAIFSYLTIVGCIDVRSAPRSADSTDLHTPSVPPPTPAQQ